MLDEVEELELVLQHYAISWGVKVPLETVETSAWAEWGITKKA